MAQRAAQNPTQSRRSSSTRADVRIRIPPGNSLYYRRLAPLDRWLAHAFSPVIEVEGRKITCAFGAALFFTLTTLFAIAIFDRRIPVDVVGGSVSPDPAAPGDTIQVDLTLKAYRQCDGQVFRRIIDSEGIVTPYIDTPTYYHTVIGPHNLGEPITFSRTLTLPKTIHQGTAKYAPIVKWWCNPLQYLFWPIQTEQKPLEFEVHAPVVTNMPLPRSRPPDQTTAKLSN